MLKHGWVEEYHVHTVMQDLVRCRFPVALHNELPTTFCTPPHIFHRRQSQPRPVAESWLFWSFLGIIVNS